MSFTGITCRYVRRFSGPVPLLKTCCGCWSVKLGAAVLATAQSVLALVHLLLLALSYLSPEWEVMLEELSSYDMLFEATLASVDVVSLCVNLLLLIGIGKGKAKLLLPAVVYYFLFVALYCVVLVAVFILFVSSRRATVSGVEILVFSLLLFFPPKILVYFWLVVYSCYRQMKNQEPSHLLH